LTGKLTGKLADFGGQPDTSTDGHTPSDLRRCTSEDDRGPLTWDWKSCVAQVTVGSNPTLSAAKMLVRALQGVPADGSAGPLSAKVRELL